MKNERVRIVNENNLQELNFIAKIHEELPMGWINDYIVDPNDIEQTFHRLIKKQHEHAIFCGIIENKNKIVSFLWAELSEKNPSVLDIMSLWTDLEYRRQGLATKLKVELEKWAKKQQGIKEIHTTVSKKNEKMVELNEKLGYETSYYRMIKQV